MWKCFYSSKTFGLFLLIRNRAVWYVIHVCRESMLLFCWRNIWLRKVKRLVRPTFYFYDLTFIGCYMQLINVYTGQIRCIFCYIIPMCNILPQLNSLFFENETKVTFCVLMWYVVSFFIALFFCLIENFYNQL